MALLASARRSEVDMAATSTGGGAVFLAGRLPACTAGRLTCMAWRCGWRLSNEAASAMRTTIAVAIRMVTTEAPRTRREDGTIIGVFLCIPLVIHVPAQALFRMTQEGPGRPPGTGQSPACTKRHPFCMTSL